MAAILPYTGAEVKRPRNAKRQLRVAFHVIFWKRSSGERRNMSALK
jgi:hypothetical protein